ncbi:hypothetical protein, partial [Tannerella forsythia]|uniref:hypothetical protein n=1 Tax=Tannerella forsythia TaxID=28112 RepID=UPI0036DE651B
WFGEFAVSPIRDGGLKSSKRLPRIIGTARPSDRDCRPATRKPPSGSIGFSGLAAFVRSEQRKTTGGIRL